MISSFFLISGIVSTFAASLPVLLNVCLKLLLDTLLSSVEECAEVDDVMKHKSLLWYGVVGVRQLHTSRLQLMDEISRKWSCFVLKLIVVNPSNKREEYGQLARVPKERSIQQNIYACIVYDIFVVCG